ncbi:MAG: hypothetical protein M3539_13650 [Acidobacteriota bacterium]|nr:hypothetical protein [Acidobacteriota bacterium]
MITQGTLRVSAGVSRLNGTRLAIEGAGNPFGAATDFLANRGLKDKDLIWVDGTNGFVGNVPVIFITDAGAAGPESASIKKKKGAKKTARKTAKKTTKKMAPKK